MEIKTTDKIVQSVLRKMDQRSLIGQKKYGATMMQEIEGEKKEVKSGEWEELNLGVPSDGLSVRWN